MLIALSVAKNLDLFPEVVLNYGINVCVAAGTQASVHSCTFPAEETSRKERAETHDK